MREEEWGFEFGVYKRPFRQPLRTAHGVWQRREGIILRLTDPAGNVNFGEIAPVPWFGSETLEAAVAFCQQLPAQITGDMIRSIPEGLPACQFGFESASMPIAPDGSTNVRQTNPGIHVNPDIRVNPGIPLSPASIPGPLSPVPGSAGSASQPLESFSHSQLLPAGALCLSAWQPLWEAGHRTFKWKIGVGAIAQELEIFRQLIERLPAAARLRLDANGALGYDEAARWLQACDQLSMDAPVVEYLEQPLAPAHLESMQVLSQQFRTAIALDESVANLTQLQSCYAQGWRGVFVIKPAIAGFPTRLRQFCQETGIDVVISSVFETAIGQNAILHLAADLMTHPRAIGFGLDHWFLDCDPALRLNREDLWQWLQRCSRLTAV